MNQMNHCGESRKMHFTPVYNKKSASFKQILVNLIKNKMLRPPRKNWINFIRLLTVLRILLLWKAVGFCVCVGKFLYIFIYYFVYV